MAKTKTNKPATAAVLKKSGDGGRIEKSGAKVQKAKVAAKAVAATKPAKTTAVADKKKDLKSVLKNGDKKVRLN
jgi:hypothetical protein